MTLHDPLLEAEKIIKKQKLKNIKVSRSKVFFTTHPITIKKRVWNFAKFAGMYVFLSGTIFSIMMGAVNFQAYSARIIHWWNPDVYAATSEEIIEAMYQGNIEIINTTTNNEEKKENRSVIEEKIAEKNPEMIYSRHYSSDHLLSNIPMASAEKASFIVNPQENRIIIPKIGKNIPLVDVDHDEGISVEKMHDVFMEELKKGIVRYPGTAKPGEVGNAFIFGHSSNYPWIQSDYNDVFVLLDTLQPGDEIIAYYNQKKFVYKVTDRAVVKPGDTKVLSSRDHSKKEISLMTCWPIGTTLERLIIFGELVGE